MNSTVAIAVSTINDGSMSKAVDNQKRLANRQRFLESKNITLSQTILVHLKYEGSDYRRYYNVSSDQAGDGIVRDSSLVADALFTSEKNLAFLLPVADCIAAVLYDNSKQVLGLAHLGRHNLVQNGGASVVRYLQDNFGSNPKDISLWLGPAAGRESYPLFDFDNRSLHEVALKQLITAGINQDNIEIDQRDTTKDASLFSHSEFLKGNRASDGRQAVVVMMHPQ